MEAVWYTNLFVCGRVAQLDRALASEAKGRGFKSRLVHQPLQQGCRLHDLDYSQEPLL